MITRGIIKIGDHVVCEATVDIDITIDLDISFWNTRVVEGSIELEPTHAQDEADCTAAKTGEGQLDERRGGTASAWICLPWRSRSDDSGKLQ